MLRHRLHPGNDQLSAKIHEWHGITPSTFHQEVVAANEPAVLRGVVSHWPAVAQGLQSPRSMAEYLKSCDLGRAVETFLGPPGIHGRFWYGADMQGFNFQRLPLPISRALDELIANLDNREPPAIYLGSTSLPEHMPKFAAENASDLMGPSTVPRVWIGNAVTVQTHCDSSDNLACVVAGRRRFTLFPPEQLRNLYVGPLDFTLAGQPVSMVSLLEPDFGRYPRFKDALAAAVSADLMPGDALYIPYLWWHHVESLDPLNVLVNYWWDDAVPGATAAFESLVHAILAVRSLQPRRRAVWRKFFEHYVFEDNGDPAAHLAAREKGILTSMTPPLALHIRTWLQRALR
jgi:hypothetical protein